MTTAATTSPLSATALRESDTDLAGVAGDATRDCAIDGVGAGRPEQHPLEQLPNDSRTDSRAQDSKARARSTSRTSATAQAAARCDLPISGGPFTTAAARAGTPTPRRGHADPTIRGSAWVAP